MTESVSRRAARRILEEIERRDMSQADVAGILEWTQSDVSKRLHGRIQLTVDDLASLCFAVGLSPTEAIRDQGYEFCAEMTPTELRFLERLRQFQPEERDLWLRLMEVKIHTKTEARVAGKPKKPIIPSGRAS